jgi:arginyl-tRNA synthetase
MVELPNGKMKSREGTVVDADELMDEMIATATEMAGEPGRLQGVPEDERDNVLRMIGLGALKYFILKVDPRKTMLFDPSESIDFNGNTGPFIQYTHARIQSVLRKSGEDYKSVDISNVAPNDKETSLIQKLADFTIAVSDAGRNYSPALIANYVYDLAKEFNQFYHDYSILREEDTAVRVFRLKLARTVGQIIKRAVWLLGIEVPERM